MAKQANLINRQELFKFYLNKTKRSFLFFISIAILLILIVFIVFKINPIEYSSLIFTLIIPLTISNIISGTFFWTSSVLLLQNKFNSYLFTTIIHSILSSFLYYLTYKYKLMGTSLSYIFISILGVTLHLLALKYELKKNNLMKKILILTSSRLEGLMNKERLEIYKELEIKGKGYIVYIDRFTKKKSDQKKLIILKKIFLILL